MARYSVNNRLAGTQQANTTTFKSQVSLTAATATLCRGAIMDWTVGADGAPNATDCQIVYDISRQTTLGTGTNATPNPIDNAVGVANTVGTVNYTVEPTVTSASSLHSVALNQRATLREYFDQGLRWPATNVNGLVARSLSPTYAANTLVTILFDE
jgi:hypothetical protein